MSKREQTDRHGSGREKELSLKGKKEKSPLTAFAPRRMPWLVGMQMARAGWREVCVQGKLSISLRDAREGTARSPGSAHPSGEWVQPPGCHSRSAVASSDTANLCTTEAGRGLGPGRAENCTCTCTLFKGRKKKRRGKGEYKAKQCAQHPPKTDKGHRRKKINFKEANLPI